MTILGWFLIGVSVVLAIILSFAVITGSTTTKGKIIGTVVVIVIALVTIGGLIFYSYGTAAGRRAFIDQKSNLNNGLERTINIYTANGDLIATYTGQIDIEDKEGGYVKFDFDGKRYMYYNCFVETIANIE